MGGAQCRAEKLWKNTVSPGWVYGEEEDRTWRCEGKGVMNWSSESLVKLLNDEALGQMEVQVVVELWRGTRAVGQLQLLQVTQLHQG